MQLIANPTETIVHAIKCAPIPPQNIRPFELTSVQIQHYDLPPKPHSPVAVTQWAYVITHIKHRICTFVRHNLPVTHPATNVLWAQRNPSPSWAGNADIQRSYNEAYGYVTLLKANGPANSLYAIWTGLGGAFCSKTIIQSGGEITVNSSGTNTATMFVENYPQDQYNAPSWENILPGDTLYSYNSNNSSYGAYSYIYDDRNGMYMASNDIPGWSTNTTGTNCSADYIVEGKIPYGIRLANFGNVLFTYASWYSAQSNTYGSVGNDNHYYFVMINRFIDASPDSISTNGTSFSVTFNNDW